MIKVLSGALPSNVPPSREPRAVVNGSLSSARQVARIVRECLATCSVENNHQDSSIKVTDPGAPQSERDRDRAERDADRAADRGGATADPASGALAAGTKAQPASPASGASPASSSRIPFTGAPVQRFALSALALLILGSMLINNARSGKALDATASGRARWRHRRRR